MRVKSSLIGEGSGSIGSTTWSHNAGGMYIRNRSMPTNPNTDKQQAVRSIVSQLVDAWANILTAGQRSGWAIYAANVPLLDVFGDPRFRSGLNHYVRSNVPLLQAGGTRVDDAPTTFNLGEYTAPAITAVVATQKASVAFTNTDDWANETGSYMLVWASRPQQNTINFFKGPYRYCGKIVGATPTPPTSPVLLDLPFDCAAGQRVFFKASVVRAHGRLSSPFRGFDDAS